jgi:hypothetical protein
LAYGKEEKGEKGRRYFGNFLLILKRAGIF